MLSNILKNSKKSTWLFLGYGHQATATNNGRIVCVFYALVGVPLNGILIAAIGNVFSAKVAIIKFFANSDKGRVSLEFWLYFFMNHPTLGPWMYYYRHFEFFENSWRYTQLKVHHRYHLSCDLLR